jgi:type IV secretory pathway VirB6-like protein
MSGLWECFTINGEIIESAFFDNGNQKNTKYYRNNEQVYTSTKYLVFTLFGAGLSVSAFAINYFFTNNLVFLWMIFYLILLVLLILIAPLFIPNKVGSYLKHLNAVMKCYSA